jgi:hypothetical protein
MKCLLVADLHYDLRKFDWVVAAAAHVDVVVLAGDHLDAAAVVGRPSATPGPRRPCRDDPRGPGTAVSDRRDSW